MENIGWVARTNAFEVMFRLRYSPSHVRRAQKNLRICCTLSVERFIFRSIPGVPVVVHWGKGSFKSPILGEQTQRKKCEIGAL